jgi:hypothetical protein
MLSSLNTVGTAASAGTTGTSGRSPMSASAQLLARKARTAATTMPEAFIQQDAYIALPGKAAAAAPAGVTLPSEEELRRGASSVGGALLSGLGDDDEAIMEKQNR